MNDIISIKDLANRVLNAHVSFVRIDEAKAACYDRLHPRPWIDKSEGSRRLYDAVCELWIDTKRSTR